MLNPYWNSNFPDAKPLESDWVEIDADKYWSEFSGKDFDPDQIREMADSYFWEVMLKHMDNTTAEKRAFWKAFYPYEKWRNRHRAIDGLVASRHRAETELLKAAEMAYKRKFLYFGDGEPPELLAYDEGREWTVGRIGDEFCRMAALPQEERSKAFERLLKAASGKISADKSQVEKRKAWEAFCRYVIDNERLPTILAFNHKAGFLKQDHGDSNSEKIRKKLGLSGLPKT
ncbi:hypothetical protein [Haloferula sp. A504]|uniref:hypothetical protein n=1 Tax=Haloferula sp. A504 TaxID=3373601 RepID=UPI0031C922BE|nr:hypothetical protein [Verrucomicrobiaceae bacterium E54]